MKKVLIIHGSPRKGGNSDVLCDDFATGAKESGHLVTKYSLQSLKLNYCLGCEYCVSHQGACVHKDSMADILQSMISSDVIVLATPVYFYAMSGQLKTMIDRTVARYTEISNKEFYFILTAAEDNMSLMQATIDELRGFISCCNNPIEKGIIYGLGAWKVGDIQNMPIRETALNMGRNV